MSEPTTATLTDWLLEQIAADEAVATDRRAHWSQCPLPRGDGDCTCTGALGVKNRRVLAECEAKRRIVELHPTSTGIWRDNPPFCMMCGEVDDPVLYPCPTVRLLALPYADRPGYREEWRP